MSDASSVHACFVYLLDRDGKRLVLRAASDPYASLAGAIENAQLYDEMRQRVGELEHLTELAEAVAAAETLEELGPEVVERSRRLLGAEAAHLYLLDADEERLHLRWSTGGEVPATI